MSPEPSKAQLESFINEQLLNPANVDVPGATTTVLYAGQFGDGTFASDIARDMAARGNGQIRVIDDTEIGRFLGFILGPNGAQYLDFDVDTEANFGLRQWQNASYNFAKNTVGNVITVTPTSSADSVYATHEIRGLLDAAPGNISNINGRDFDEVQEMIDGRPATSQEAMAKAIFDGDFADIVSNEPSVRIIAQYDANGVRIGSALDIDSVGLAKLGSDVASLSPIPSGGAIQLEGEELKSALRPSVARRMTMVVCLEKIGPILKRARLGMRIGEMYGTSAIYAGADHREAA